ncbi:MAG: hypothetical protein NDI94_02785 [Candidatus Woesearchaeota archaeon]|nr:hypothetical protein [Candidatus Woesearchaeota archaeon]
MTFSKSFPITSDKSFTKWEEITLTNEEERYQESLARKDNIKKMNECIEDAKKIIEGNRLKPYQTDMIHVAIALFEKRGSHEIYYKENKAKEKFDQK